MQAPLELHRKLGRFLSAQPRGAIGRAIRGPLVEFLRGWGIQVKEEECMRDCVVLNPDVRSLGLSGVELLAYHLDRVFSRERMHGAMDVVMFHAQFIPVKISGGREMLEGGRQGVITEFAEGLCALLYPGCTVETHSVEYTWESGVVQAVEVACRCTEPVTHEIMTCFVMLDAELGDIRVQR